ncbi:MAG: YbgA family protein [Sulfurihydrogenibium sp.]
MDCKPKVVLSRCINKEPVRYNGGIVTDKFAEQLENYVEYITVCPEVDVGMPVPRPTILLAKINDSIKVIEPNTKTDYTEKLEDFSKNFLNQLKEVDGFFLKAKSPSCGVMDAKLYKDDLKHSIGKTDGIFASYAKKYFPHLPVEDEGRLNDYWIRRDFLTKIFAYADFRCLKNSAKSIKDLIKFHQRYKYLYMLYSPKNLKTMGNLIANWDKIGFEDTVKKYEELFKDTFSKHQTINRHINVLQHIYGHFSDLLKPGERRHFSNLLQKMKEDRLYLKVTLEFIKNFIYRFEDEYLSSQKYLYPYPEDLEKIV